MCGIAGFIDRFSDAQTAHAQICRMTGQLEHRGPDDEGVWMDADSGVALGFRRLAILDLSPAGHQPMTSECGRYVIVFNGEVYNFMDLRRELEAKGYRFIGGSDTEVMLAAISKWGVLFAVERFVGMFAFALWDRQERTLTLVRDRIGIKPLYYGWAGKAFIFGSELKALAIHRDFDSEIDRNALAAHMQFQYVPTPYSIYAKIRKLKPGSILTARLDSLTDPSVYSYWSAKAVSEGGAAKPFRGSAEEAAERLEALLREAVALRMIADVPIGAFLSGGVDSSLVAALMQSQSSRSVQTFTIGFHEDAYNEANHAKQVAAHLGTQHTEFYVTSEEALTVISKLPDIYDEPFSDSSQIPTYLVSALARRHVTVSLSGDGGDELFGGYNRYFWGDSVWKSISRMPRIARWASVWGIRRLSQQAWNSIFETFEPAIPGRFRVQLPGEKLHKLADILPFVVPEDLCQALVSHWRPSQDVVIGGCAPAVILNTAAEWANLPTFIQKMMFLDQVTYLPDDILTKLDRATMAVSLEGRVPFLDHRVVEFAAQLPLEMKVRPGVGKYLLRRVLYKYVPQRLIDRPKMGFALPIDRWLRGPLRDWCEDLLSESRLRQGGYLRPEPIRKLWNEHLSGRRNWHYHLWDVLMFQAWRERWEKPRGWIGLRDTDLQSQSVAPSAVRL